jgi:hypothetical protein
MDLGNYGIHFCNLSGTTPVSFLVLPLYCGEPSITWAHLEWSVLQGSAVPYGMSHKDVIGCHKDVIGSILVIKMLSVLSFLKSKVITK